MNTSLRKENNADELDLGHVMLKVNVFYRRFGKSILILSLLGMIIGGVLYKLLPRNYKATMILQSSVLSNAQSLQIIEGWNNLLNKQGRPTLAGFFGLPLDTLKELASIKITLIPGSPDEAALTLDVIVTDSNVLAPLQRGVIYALENNPYIRERLEVRRRNQEDQIEKSREELQRLDSIKPYLHSFSGGDKDASGKLILDVSSISTERLSVEDRITSGVERLQFMKAAYVLQGFVQSKTTRGVPSPVLPLAGLILGFILGYARALRILFREKYITPGKPATT